MAVNIFIILSLMVCAVTHYMLEGTSSKDGIFVLMATAVAVNFAFTVELVVHIAVFGFARALRVKSQLNYEIVLQIVFLYSLQYFFYSSFLD